MLTKITPSLLRKPLFQATIGLGHCDFEASLKCEQPGLPGFQTRMPFQLRVDWGAGVADEYKGPSIRTFVLTLHEARTNNMIRSIISIIFFSGLLCLNIYLQSNKVDRAHRLMESGVLTTAALDEVTITTSRKYGIPFSKEGRFDYHFKTGNGERIEGIQNVSMETVKAISADGKTFRVGTPIKVKYLPDHPSTNLPVSELNSQAVFDRTSVLLPGLCLGGACFMGLLRLRSFSSSYSSARKDISFADLRTEEGPGIYTDTTRDQQYETPAPTPAPAPSYREPVPSSIAPRTLPKAAGAARPAFGKRA